MGHPSFRNRPSPSSPRFYYNLRPPPHGYNRRHRLSRDYSLNWKSATRDFERGQQDHIIADHWQTDTSISNGSWGYVEHDTFKDSRISGPPV